MLILTRLVYLSRRLSILTKKTLQLELVDPWQPMCFNVSSTFWYKSIWLSTLYHLKCLSVDKIINEQCLQHNDLSFSPLSHLCMSLLTVTLLQVSLKTMVSLTAVHFPNLKIITFQLFVRLQSPLGDEDAYSFDESSSRPVSNLLMTFQSCLTVRTLRCESGSDYWHDFYI